MYAPHRKLLLAATTLLGLAALGVWRSLSARSAAFWRLDEVHLPLPAVERALPASPGAWEALVEVTAARPRGCDRSAIEDALAGEGGEHQAWSPCARGVEALMEWTRAHPGVTAPRVNDAGDALQLAALIDLTRAGALQARWSRRRDAPREALEILFALAGLGVRLEHAGGGVLYPYVGAAVQEGVYEELEAWFSEAPAAVAPMESLLAAAAALPSGLPLGIREDCLSVDAVLETDLELALRRLGPGGPSAPARWLFDPGKTRALHRAWCRDRLEQMAAPPAARAPVTLPELPGGPPLAWVDHAVGRRLLAVLTIGAYREEEIEALRSRRALLAGALLLMRDPAAAPPADPWDGEPLGWDARRRVLSSRAPGDGGGEPLSITLPPT